MTTPTTTTIETSTLQAILDELKSLRSEVTTLKANKAQKTTKVDNSSQIAEQAKALHAKVIAAAKADTVKNAQGYYKSYTGHFIIGGGLKKYGENAEFKPSTIIAAAKDYGFIK